MTAQVHPLEQTVSELVETVSSLAGTVAAFADDLAHITNLDQARLAADVLLAALDSLT